MLSTYKCSIGLRVKVLKQSMFNEQTCSLQITDSVYQMETETRDPFAREAQPELEVQKKARQAGRQAGRQTGSQAGLPFQELTWAGNSPSQLMMPSAQKVRC